MVETTQIPADSEEVQLKNKCNELKRRINEIEENNEIATLALSRTKAAIRRLRMEYIILLERLEDRATAIPDGINVFEEMQSPPVPTVVDESLYAAGMSKNGATKKTTKKSKAASSSATNGTSSTTKQKSRDPDLPKRPTNAYLIFCEMEKDRIKAENEEKNPGSASDLSKSMTEAWKNLPEDDRKPYYKLYEDDRMRYQKEKAVYNQKKQTSDEIEEPKTHKKKKLNSAAAEPTPEIPDEKEPEIEPKEEIDNEFDDDETQMDPPSSQTIVPEVSIKNEFNDGTSTVV